MDGKHFGALAAALFLSACEPGSDAQINSLVTHGHLTVETGGDDDNFDRKLVFANVWDIGYDLDNASDRKKFVYGAVSRNCLNPRITDERRAETSVTPIGRTIATYTVLVDCS